MVEVDFELRQFGTRVHDTIVCYLVLQSLVADELSDTHNKCLININLINERKMNELMWM